MDEINQTNNKLVNKTRSSLIKVNSSVSIVSKILSGQIEKLFNEAFCLLNGISIKDNKENFLEIFDINIRHLTCWEYRYNAKFDNYHFAIDLLKQIINIQPNHIISYEMIGMAYYKLKQYDLSIFYTSKAINIDSNYYPLYNLRGLSKEKLTDYRSAMSDFTKSIDIYGNLNPAYYNRGNLNLETKNFEEAIKDFSKSIEILSQINKTSDPFFAKAFLHRGESNYHLKFYNDAIEDISQSINLLTELGKEYYSNLGAAYFIFGCSYLETCQYNNSIMAFNKVLNLNVGLDDVTYFRGVAYLKLYEIAISEENSSIENIENFSSIIDNNFDSNNVVWRYNLMSTVFHLVLKDFSKYLSLYPKDKKTFNNLGKLKFETSNLESAVADFTKAIALDKNYILAYYNRACTKLRLKDFKGAANDFFEVVFNLPSTNIYSDIVDNSKIFIENISQIEKEYLEIKTADEELLYLWLIDSKLNLKKIPFLNFFDFD